MEIFFFWFVFSVLVGIYASGRGRSGFIFFIFSLLLSPLIGFIIALLSPPIKEKIEANELKSGNMKKCVKCAELVKMEAKVCKHCSHEFALYKG